MATFLIMGIIKYMFALFLWDISEIIKVHKTRIAQIQYCIKKNKTKHFLAAGRRDKHCCVTGERFCENVLSRKFSVLVAELQIREELMGVEKKKC